MIDGHYLFVSSQCALGCKNTTEEVHDHTVSITHP